MAEVGAEAAVAEAGVVEVVAVLAVLVVLVAREADVLVEVVQVEVFK